MSFSKINELLYEKHYLNYRKSSEVSSHWNDYFKKYKINKKGEKFEFFTSGLFSYEDRKIDFRLTSFEIINKIRAYSTKPGAWFLYNNERIKILSAMKKNNKGKPSTILNNNFELGCLDGCILPISLQREGRNVVQLEDFLRGFNFSAGDILND